MRGYYTVNNGEYSLHCRVLSPASAKIELIGGEGREFFVDGVNYDTDAKDNTEAGWGRIAITDTAKSTLTEFKVEMEIRRNKQ